MITAFSSPSSTLAEVIPGDTAWHSLATLLSKSTLPCQRVKIMAPSANHPVGTLNSGDIMVAPGQSQAPNNAAGSTRIANDGSRDQWFHVTDLNTVYVKTPTAGDAIEVEIVTPASNAI